MPDAPTPRSAATAAPVPQSPVQGAVVPLDTATFRWSAPPSATSFDLRIALASDAGTPHVEIEAIPSTEATLADALPPGDALWWVRQTGGAWSAPASFRAGTAADVEVARGAETERVAQAAVTRSAALPEVPPDPVWPYVEGDSVADAQPLDWATVPGFAAPIRDDRPQASAEAPRPLGPLGGEIVDAVTLALRWVPVAGATGYDVELSPHAAFARDVLSLDAGEATEIGLAGLVPASGRKLLWRVRARVGDAATPWSPYGRFYPATDAATDTFQTSLHTARAVRQRQIDHERLETVRELDLLPNHERPDAVTSTATLGAVVGMALSGLVIGLIALALTLFL